VPPASDLPYETPRDITTHCVTDSTLLNATHCRALGIQPHPSISKALSNDEDPTAPILEICTDTEIGTAGVRAFCAALLGKGIGMKSTGYKHIKSLRFWRSGCGDAGVAAVVSSRSRQSYVWQSGQTAYALSSQGGCYPSHGSASMNSSRP
jgi:hypothetical protein